MNRLQAIDECVAKITRAGREMTTAQMILALAHLYDVGHANGIIAGTQHTVAAIELVNSALQPHAWERDDLFEGARGEVNHVPR